MLTLCSSVRTKSKSAASCFFKAAKKGCQNPAIVGVLVMLVMTVVFGLFNDDGEGSLAAYMEMPSEQYAQADQTGETELFTEAKISFQFTESALEEEGRKLVGDTLVQSMILQEELKTQQQNMIDQASQELRRAKAEQEQIAAREAEAKAEAEAKQAAAAIPYSNEDYEILKRIVQAESGGCDMKGRILIANVIMNRVRSNEFPDTIAAVVYQKSQFSPVADGSMKSCTVTDTTIEAVDRALAGEDYSQGALYFMNRKLSMAHNVSWFDQKLTYLFQYDKHEFFK